MAVKVGVGYLQIQPEISASDFAAQMNRSLSGTLTRASKEMGTKAGNDMGTSMSEQAAQKTGETLPKALHAKATPGARRAGEEVGARFGEGMVEKARGGLSRLGSLVGIGLASFGVEEIVKSSLEAATAATKAGKITDAILASTGGAAHVSAAEVHEYGEKLAGLTGVHADVINSAQNLLLTFTNVRNEAGAGNNVFDLATKAALNMSAVMGTSAPEAAQQLGKALNDPVKGLTTLRRAGIQFNEQQTEQIKSMVKSGDTLGAQKIILGAVQTKFGEAAAASATPMAKLSAVVEILKEKLGTLLLPVISNIAGFLVKTGVPAFEGLIAGLKGTASEGDGPAATLNKIGGVIRQIALDVKAALPALIGIFKAVAPYLPVILAMVGAYWAWHKAMLAIAFVQKIIGAFKLAEGAEGLATGWIGLIIVGVAALVIGLVYAYKHFKTFRDIVNTALRDAGKAATWMWVNAIKPAFEWISKVGIPAVVQAANWLWHKVLKPVLLDFIIPAFKLLWAGIKLYVGFVVAMLRVEFAVVMWVWTHILKPVILGFIVPAFKLLWAGIKLYVGFIVAMLRIEFAVVMWVWTNVIRPAVSFIVAGFKFLYAAVKIYIEAWIAVIRTIAAVAMWLWHNIFEPVFKGIGVALKIVWDFIIWPIFRLFLFQFKLIGLALALLWTGAVRPILRLVGDLFTWLYANAVKPAIDAIGIAAKAVGAAFMWLWHEVFEPVGRGIGAVATWLWRNAIKPAVDAIVVEFKGFEILLGWLWHTVFEPAIHGVGAVVSWLWDNAIKPTLETIKGAFSAAVDWIGKVWAGLGDALMVPVKFIVNVVYNEGIRKAWNFIADIVKFKELPPFTIGAATAPPAARPVRGAFQRGGVVPGSGDGDIVPAMLEPGERVLSRAQVLLLGGHSVLDRLVGRGTGSGWLFQGGGIVEQIPGFGAILGLINKIPGAGTFHDLLTSTIMSGLNQAASFILGFPGAKELLGLAGSVVTGAEHVLSRILDTGGWLDPGRTLVANNTGAREAVLRPAAVTALGGASAVDALNGGRRPPFGDVHVTVNNPVPERASQSVPSAMRSLAFQLAG